jgi:uncharacterized protein
MDIYLPIAEMSVNIFGIFALGILSGILSGMFGVGGGFLTTPFLMFIGIPAPVAVASSANQVAASSLTGFLAHWRRGNVDFRMGVLLLIGGVVGSSAGVWLFSLLKDSGHFDLVISLLYVTLLGSIGVTMGLESIRTLRQVQEQPVIATAVMRFAWLSRLPGMMDFPRSKLRLSAVLPLSIGVISGMLVSLLGVGGGFFMIPAMIYGLGMPTSVVIGTSLFQIIFTTANVTFLQAITTQTVDVILAILLISGSVVGAQMGTRIGSRMNAANLRGWLALIVLTIALKLAFGLFTQPDEIYTFTMSAP